MHASSAPRPPAFVTYIVVSARGIASRLVVFSKRDISAAVPNARLARDVGMDPNDLVHLTPPLRSADWQHPRL